MSNVTLATSDNILKTGLGFWPSKILLSAVKLDLFTLLDENDLSISEIQQTLHFHGRALADYLDSLVALGFLERFQDSGSERYRNSADSQAFLIKGKPGYLGGFLKMANERLYSFWGHLEEALISGEPQNESKNGEGEFFSELYASEETLREFSDAMGTLQSENFRVFSKEFDFKPHHRVLDLGGCGAYLSIQLASDYPHLSCTSFDLEALENIARENVKEAGLCEQVCIQNGDFFRDDLPASDVVIMGNILHDWSEEERKFLIRKVYDLLPKGGALVVIEDIIDAKRKNLFALMMSLNMLIETAEGSNFTYAEFEQWSKEAEFVNIEIMPLGHSSSAVCAFK